MAVLWTKLHHQSHHNKDGVAHRLWGFMSDIAIALKDFLFQIPINTAVKMPPGQTRRAACTHLTMTPLYGDHRCAHCYRPSRLGCVYSCTQDEYTHTATLDEMNEGMKELNVDECSDTDGQNERVALEAVKLKPWMEQAILEGRYTPDQVTILRAQRLKVINSIAAAEYEFAQHHKPAPTPPRSTSLPTAPTYDRALPITVSQDTTEEAEVKEPVVTDESIPVPKLVSDCEYKTCQVCRPISRDRAWQRIGPLPEDSINPAVPDFAAENRPISDANVVRYLGLHKTKLEHDLTTLFNTNDEQDQDLVTDDDRTTEDTGQEDSPAESDLQKMAAFGGRAGARSARRNMMVRPRQESTDSRTSKDSNNSGKWAKRRESVRDSVLKKYMEKFGRDLGDSSVYEGGPTTYKSWKNGLGSSAKKEKKERGSGLRVNNGVAVTEEAVDLGTADIIMQA